MSDPQMPDQPGHQPPPPWQQSPYGSATPAYDQPIPAAPTSRKRLWIGLSAGAVVLLLISIGGFFAMRAASDKPSANPQPNQSTSGDKSPSPSPSPSPSKKAVITLVAPSKLGTRAKITDPEHLKLATSVEAAMMQDKNATSAVAAYYGTPDAKKNKVYLAGVTTNVPMSATDLASTFQALATGAGSPPATNLTDADAGPMGGAAMCGLLQIQGMPVAACAWGDEGCFVFVMWFNREVTSQIKAELLTIRPRVEVKS